MEFYDAGMNTSKQADLMRLAGRYVADGFCIVDDLLCDEECDRLKAESQRILDSYARSGATVYVGASVVSPLFAGLAADRRVIDILTKIMPEGVMFLSDKIVLKSAAKQFATPWHIDAAYWPNTRPKLSVWIPLDDVSASNGTLKVVPGSHLRNWKHETSDMRSTNSEFNQVISDQQWTAADEVTCTLRRGGAVIFSDRLLHASHPNDEAADRYTIISTYHVPADDEAFDRQFAGRRIIVPAAEGRR